MTTTPESGPGAAPGLPVLLERWVGRDLISREQADAILAAEGAAAPAPVRRTSLVGEALGYVGGVLVLVAAGMIAGLYWGELRPGGRLALTAGAALILLAAGAALPPRLGPAGYRLRSVSWLLSTGLLAAALVLTGDEILQLDSGATTLLAAGVTAGYAATLWAWHPAVLQHGALVAALAVAVGAAAARLPGGDETVVGLAVWGAGVAWMLLGRGRPDRDRESAVFGGAAAVVGALLALPTGWGTALALATAAGLVVAGAAAGELVLLVVGAVATLAVVPSVLGRWFPDTLTAPIGVLVTGAVLVALALQVTRRRDDGRQRRAGRTVRPVVTTTLAAAVVLAVGAMVLALGAT